MAIADTLNSHGCIWKRKPVVRIIYDDLYDRISRFARPGLTIEIGGGIGNFKSRLVNVVSTDVQFAPWLDCVAEAHQLTFRRCHDCKHCYGRCSAPQILAALHGANGR